MKKGLKFGITCLAVFGMLAAFLTSLNTANAGTTAQLKLVLSRGGESSCTLTGEGSWTATASTSQQTATVVKNILTGSCTLNEAQVEYVKLPGQDLEGSAGTIAISNVKTTNVCTTGSTISGICKSQSSTALSIQGIQLFEKTVNKIGTVTLKETLSLTVPAGQAPGTYIGEVSIMVTQSS